MIKSVDIYYPANFISGFAFFNKDKQVIFKIGSTGSWMKVATVVIADNEVIVGVAARLYIRCKYLYTDF